VKAVHTYGEVEKVCKPNLDFSSKSAGATWPRRTAFYHRLDKALDSAKRDRLTAGRAEIAPAVRFGPPCFLPA
jgi:hypothetical protein